MTDVVTSLASGMPLWMVAIQQGGQITDSFGGLGNIFEIIASKFRDVSTSSEDAGDSLADTAGDAAEGAEQFRSLFSGVTLARVGLVGVAAVIAAVGYAAYSASGDQDKFNESIAKSGNFAGTTAGQLEDMAVSIGGMKSNYGDVRDILNGLVSSGKFTGETLNSVAQAASMMAELSGQSADQVVSQFTKMTDGVASWAASTNQQYHYLDLETYQRIQNLEDQGRKEEAIEVASQALKKATEERLKEMERQLNWVARAWGNVKDAASDTWESFKGGVAAALGINSLDDQISRLEKTISDGGTMAGSVFIPVTPAEKGRLDLLKQQRDELLKTAQAEAKRKQTDADTIVAADKLQNIWKGNRSELEKTADAVEETRKNYETLWKSATGRDMLQSRGVTSTDGKNFSGGQWDIDVKALDKSAQGAEQYNKQLQQTLNQKKAITELDRVEAEIRNGALTGASKGEQDKARALAKQIDAAEAARKASQEGARATKQEAEENQRFVEQLQKQADKRVEGAAATRAQEIATRNLTAEQRRQAEAANAAITAQEFQGQNLQLQLEYMRDTGDAAGASLLEVRNKFANLRREFEASGNTEGLNWLDKLLPVAETKIRVDDLKKQLDDLFTYQSQQETSIQAQVQGGLLNEIQGRQRLVQLHQEVGDKIKGYLPQLKELATAPGEAGDKIREMIRQLEEELGKLNQAGNELTQAFRDGLQNGIETSLVGLAKGTMSLSDAVRNLALSIVDSMAKIAAQQLAQMATSSLVGASGGMGGLLASVFAADGGQVRGPGSTTSDSIPAMLSDQEFVTRAAVVQQPGALDFLHAFNRHGMAAVQGWLPRVRHATGGLAGIPAQNMPVPATVPETAMATPAAASQQPISLQQQLVLDPSEVYTAGAQTLAGQRQFTTSLKAQVPTLKQWLGLNK
ncbi:phage tail length tape measure family protein, partial [Klebsiella quasipneumoniae]|uniref:phage tail length tape measure family protein n=1 Tax=Klebsiella quasipneumoniae TaxID=1463165 RepID=UPI0021DAB0D6